MEFLKQIIVVDRVVVPNVAKFSLVGTGEFKDNAVCSIHSETPNLVMLWMQFFGPEGRMKWVAFKPLGSSRGFSLNVARKCLK